jgi:glycosyltransferase involved in cell wall biosynthesis
VLLATFNGRKYLEQQVASILGQTHRNLRVLICDDCSSDGTERYVDTLTRVPNATILHNPTNVGPAKTFERLLSHVTSPYFCFADQDDVWLPEKIEKLLALVQARGLVLAYSDMEVVGESLQEIAPSMWRYADVKPLDTTSLVPYLLRNPVSGCSLLADSRLIRLCLPFPQQVPMHDWWLALCAVQEGPVGYLHEATVKYRQHGVNALGAVPSGTRGLRRRLQSRGPGLTDYAAYRAERRISLARQLCERRPDPALTQFLSFVDQPTARRVLRLPSYVLWLVRNASELGFKTVLKEAFMNTLPRRIAGDASA